MDFSYMADYLEEFDEQKPVRVSEEAFAGLDNWNTSTDYWILNQ